MDKLKSVLKHIVVWPLYVIAFTAFAEFVLGLKGSTVTGLSLMTYPALLLFIKQIKMTSKFLRNEEIKLSFTYKMLVSICIGKSFFDAPTYPNVNILFKTPELLAKYRSENRMSFFFNTMLYVVTIISLFLFGIDAGSWKLTTIVALYGAILFIFMMNILVIAVKSVKQDMKELKERTEPKVYRASMVISIALVAVLLLSFIFFSVILSL